ncbi:MULTISPECIES: NAD(P)H-dependent oxidoreductase [Acinetobacter]|uniref:NAD(P)H-dependent oxidoreductase n=1 Tax=Acinetobacter TaxID=469 RepID=UPI00124F8B5D|nr:MULTISPECIES: NAD(P)H-dependent oxidoreductase [Acinetobacter]MCU4359663.1 NAD(P)H-dependent oxidoreductase [Acinetobacter ursingii]MCU4590114.1 NAD(P)H-dependent oxidoreductase [Acinetobacter ursingii]
MKKTLVIVAHPQINESVVNQRWAEELRKHPDEFTVHEIYKAYSNGVIDVAKEQSLIEEHENLIFQFPIYWFNCPPLFKQWLDEVFTYGWAYGSTGDKLKNKKIMLAVSAGIKSKDYSDTGRYQLQLNQVLYPFELTALYVEADYQPIYAFYGTESNPTSEDVDQSAVDYVQKLLHLANIG